MRTLVALAAGLLLAGGCSGSEPSEPRNYTTQEVAWLERLGHWEAEYSAASAKIDPAYAAVFAGEREMSYLHETLRPLKDCARQMRSQVGKPPTKDLEVAFRLLLDACAEDRRIALLFLRSFSPGREQVTAQHEAKEKADALYERAHNHIERRLLANRLLPVLGGMVTKSRIEPRLSRATESVVPKRIEIRCWAPRDWAPTKREWVAYAGSSDVAGFVTGTNRAHISPVHCADLTRFVYTQWRPVDPGSLADLAESVVLLAHEMQHLVSPSGTESETECRAAQDLRHLARALGASRSYAARLAEVYWSDIYPFESKQYRSPECRNGGLLDMNPSDVWP